MMRHLPTMPTLLLGFVLLAACSSNGTETLDRRMASYIGQPEVRLVEGLGVPLRVYESEGRRFLEYDFGGTSAPASSGLSFGFGAGSFGGSRYGRGGGIGTGLGVGFPLGGSGYEAAPCPVTFEIRNGQVLDFRRQGEICRG
jgi:hypothetical protein